VRIVNLPGHGGAPDAPANRWPDILIETLPKHPSILIGWSLGGMLSLQLARARPDKVAGLVLVSSTPCFRTRTDWPFGCPDVQFSAFEHALKQDAEKLLAHFFGLMLQGDTLNRDQHDAIVRAATDHAHTPTPRALKTGLTLLDTLDLRPILADISAPALVLHGRRDAVIPLRAGRFLAGRMPTAQLHLVDSGHAPHLTRSEIFNHALEAWCLNIT